MTRGWCLTSVGGVLIGCAQPLSPPLLAAAAFLPFSVEPVPEDVWDKLCRKEDPALLSGLG